MSGTLYITGSGGVTTELHVGADGAFTTTAQVGVYTIVGRSPAFSAEGIQGDCYTAGQRSVTVVAGRTTKTDVYCLR